jgi:hypothetical protein
MWVHFPLHPETPADGITIEALFAGREIDVDAMYERIKSLMDAEGSPYGRRSHTYNSRLAQELGTWANTQPGVEAIHDVLNKAYFVEGLNRKCRFGVTLALIRDARPHLQQSDQQIRAGWREGRRPIPNRLEENTGCPRFLR